MSKYVKSELQSLSDSGRTLEQIGFKYGVTRQRMYQIFNALGINTPERTRKSQLQDWNEKQKWLWKIIATRNQGQPKLEKLALFNSIELPDVCPVLGIPLDYSFGKGSRIESSPSLDQKLPGQGYEIGNVDVISWRANRIKNDGTPEEHQKIADYYSNAVRGVSLPSTNSV